MDELTANVAGVAVGQYYFTATPDGRGFCFDLNSGIAIWEFGKYGTTTAPLKYFNNNIYMGDHSGRFWVADASIESDVQMRRIFPAALSAEFDVSQRGILVPCQDGKVYALNAYSLMTMWPRPFPTDGRLKTAPQVSQRSVLQYAQGDNFYCLDLTSGEPRWAMPEGRKVLAAMDKNIYVLDSGNMLRVVDELTGKISVSLPLTGLNLFLGNTEVEAIFAADTSGRIYCIRPKSAGVLTLDKLQ